MILAAYVTGHGFGHFVRSSAVLSRLPGVRIHLRTNERALSLADRATWAASISDVDVGPGVAPRGPLDSDLPATRAALARHLDAWPRLLEREVAFLRESRANLVFGDVPPIALAAAAEANVPSVAMANFSWSWIYDGFAMVDSWFSEAATVLRDAEARTTLLLELEMGGGLEHFPRRRKIAPVARPIARSREAILADLGLDRPFVLFSLGGFGAEQTLRIGGTSRWPLVVTSATVLAPPNTCLLQPRGDFPHQELVAAAECLIGKPGYGTVSECMWRPTPMCYLARASFREGPALAAGIRKYLPSAPITLEDLANGDWVERVETAISAQPRPAPKPEGAAEAASILLEMLRGQGR